MRRAFIETLCSLAETDERIVLLTGDLGFMVMEPFQRRFPGRYFNVGVAEQNLIGVATGLAEAGLLPYAYSLASFASLRALEFIRNGPVLHRLPVRIVGMGMGFEYGHAGSTHYALEDIGVLRTLPGLTIMIPADSARTAAAVRKTHLHPGPIYYSLGKDDQISLPALRGEFQLGRLQVIRQGGEVAILSMGSVSQEAVAAGDELERMGSPASVAVVSGFHPDPSDDTADMLANCRHAVTVEAQTVSGGLGAFVAYTIASRGLNCRLHALAVRQSPDGTSGSQSDRWRKHGLDRANIVATVLKALGEGR